MLRKSLLRTSSSHKSTFASLLSSHSCVSSRVNRKRMLRSVATFSTWNRIRKSSATTLSSSFVVNPRSTTTTTTTTTRIPSTSNTHRSTMRPFSSSSSIDNTTNPNKNDKKRATIVIPKWPRPSYECNGDYRQEAFLETQHVGGPLYEHQPNLPKLPIPTLEETINTFLGTALPLAENQREKEALQQACHAFPVEAQHLQQRLIQRKEGDMQHSSWLQQWWNQLGYLQVRDPVVIYVSYVFLLQDDHTLPHSSYHEKSASSGSDGEEEEKKNDTTATTPAPTPRSPVSSSYSACIQRGAAALCASATYRNQIASGMEPQERIGKQRIPLCSSQKKYLFHTCRIPKPQQDYVRIYDPCIYKHTIVACHGKFYKIPLVHDDTHEPFALEIYEELLKEVVRKACYTGGGGTASSKDTNENIHSLPIGLLTTSNRDDWAKSRSELIRLGGGERMEQALTELESGALVLCLDVDDEVYSCQQNIRHTWYGSPWNRWFDKSAQLVVTKNGKIGYIGEHSMMDGMPAVSFCNEVVNNTYGKCIETNDSLSTTASLTTSLVDSVQDIFENVWSDVSLEHKREIQGLITKAKADFVKLSTDHEMYFNSFHGYGSNFMKKAGHSPDAYFQVAIQLASYRLFGKQVGTYESTQVRPFLHGRTETTRSVSLESQAFVEQMGLRPTHDEHDSVARKKKLELFQKATNAHHIFTGKASQGMGVDRHFFGLSMCVKDGEHAPSLFSDPVFARSKKWRVSTSTTPHCPGFGEVVPDGVGLGYLVKPDSCLYSVSSLKEKQYAEALVHFLKEALLEIRTMIELDALPESKM